MRASHNLITLVMSCATYFCRIGEYLAVLRLKGTSTNAPIILFVGPPGIGKTTLASSVAEVLGRPFVR